MSAQPEHRSAGRPPVKSPAAIRAALLPEDVADFDAGYRQVMADATESLDLTGVTAFIEQWWRIAWSASDPAAHRTMLAHATALQNGEPVPTTPWLVARARLGL